MSYAQNPARRLAQEILLFHRRIGAKRFLIGSALMGERVPEIVSQVDELLQQMEGASSIELVPAEGILESSDAVSVLASADAAILVVRAKRTDRDFVKEVRRRIEQQDIPLVGVVCSDFRERVPKIVRRIFRLP